MLIQRAVAAFVRGPADGLIVLGGPSANAQRDLIAAMVARHRLPAVYAARYFVTAGGLISYGPDVVDQFRRGPGTSIASSRARRRATCRSRRRPSSRGSSISERPKASASTCRRRCLPPPTRSSNEAARVHRADRRWGGVAARGTSAAAGNAGGGMARQRNARGRGFPRSDLMD